VSSELVRFKWFLREVDQRAGLAASDLELMSVSQHWGVVPRTSLTDAEPRAEDLSAYKVCERNDVVLNRMSAYQGAVGVATQPGVVSPDYAVLRPTGMADGRYMAYVMKSHWFVGQMTMRLRGIGAPGSSSVRTPRVNVQDLGEVLLPNRSLVEQQRIADFLDDQVARIDALVDARERQLTLARSSVESVSHAAVTGAAVTMRRRSSLPWSPTLPSEWGEPRICQIAKMGTGHTPSRSEPTYWTDCTIPWLTTADVHRFRKDEIDQVDDTELRISPEGLANSAAVLHPAGTVALSRTASAGFSIVMGRDMATSQDYATWTCGPRLLPEFLLWCLRAMRRDLLGRLATGSTHKTIYFPELMSIRVPLPPLQEQVAAVSSIREAVEPSRSTGDLIAASIDLLQEFKRSLISAAVAGEFDVTSASGRGVPA
jgi:type I restriction enzyme S subunit